ncbi:hypothetical protein OUZ56_024107 [Daphnia magna]|uniref:Uncharacterized protein n=1 Tax=Daphnia magna TaxID=35525 RepID=A0ABR0B060_9CRUS|nr:hypothetical protein OUZ56_024107 [Daphnia magna]
MYTCKLLLETENATHANSIKQQNPLVFYFCERHEECGGALLKERKKTAASQPEAPQFVATLHTPTILCFLRTHLGKPGMLACVHKILECEDFMLRTNRERIELNFLNICAWDASFHYMSPGT